VTTWARSRKSWAISCCRSSTTPNGARDRRFGFADVASAIADKMVDRHPHVFATPDRHGEARPCPGSPQAAERAAKRRARNRLRWCLGWVARASRALAAEKIQKRAPESA